MAAAQTSVASLMQKTLHRQTERAQMKLKFKRNQVEQIILSHIRDGNMSVFSDLLKVLKEFSLSDENFTLLFEDCTKCVVVLGRDMTQLVEVLCGVDWVTRNEERVELYSSFVLNLVTAHTYHCQLVMRHLVNLFKVNGTNWEEKSIPDYTVRQWSIIHTIIAQIVATMPMTSDVLMKTVIEQFPYYKAGCYSNRAYVHNLIWMSKYIPSLREQIITTIVNRLLVMDVNITDNAKNKCQAETTFEMDIDETQDDLSVTLDYCMLEVLRWLEEERTPALQVMCNVFERLVLPTHGIRHVQFLVMYTISISQQCADRVLTALWQIASGRHGGGAGALATRRTAAAHLAGLLARAIRVPNTRLIQYLREMADWCHAYINATQDSTTASISYKVHGAFHAVCHAIFYLIAFKHHHLFTTKEGVNFVESLNVTRLVTCALNPLRTCAAQVIRALCAVTRAHQVAYCQPTVEKNARLALHDTETLADEWFPYDPYTLPVSGKIIWPLCVEYKDWPQDGDDETQYNGMTRKLETEDDDYLVMASPSQKLASSLSNCISPGFKNSDNVLF